MDDANDTVLLKPSPAPTAHIEGESSPCTLPDTEPLLEREPLSHGLPVFIPLPPLHTLRGERQVTVNAKLSVFRLDDHMLYVIIAEPIAGLGRKSPWVSLLPPALTRIRNTYCDFMPCDVVELMRDVNNLCFREPEYWRNPQLKHYLYNTRVQVYSTFMELVTSYFQKKPLTVFVNVEVKMMDRTDWYQAPVRGHWLHPPSTTPDMAVTVMPYYYTLHFTRHEASLHLTKITDMLSFGVCYKEDCILPLEVEVYEGD